MHLDGKTLRHTGRTTPKLKALHVVSAWAGQTGLTLGQVAVDAKSNEITAMPPLLEFLNYVDGQDYVKDHLPLSVRYKLGAYIESPLVNKN